MSILTDIFYKARHPGLDCEYLFLRFTAVGKKYRRSRWLPHQGKREIARRLRNMEARKK